MNVTDHTHNTFSSGFQHDILTMGLTYSVHDTMHAVVRNEHTIPCAKICQAVQEAVCKQRSVAFTLAITEACE